MPPRTPGKRRIARSASAARRLFVACAAVLGCGVGAACFSPLVSGLPEPADAGDASVLDAPSTDGPRVGDGGSDASADALGDGEGDAAPCTESLDASSCPTTYAEGAAQCHSDAGWPWEGPSALASCQGSPVVVYGGGSTSRICLYDDAGTLVGAQVESDISEYCGNTSYQITSGDIPAACSYPWVRSIDGAGADSGVTECQQGSYGASDATPD